MPKARRVTRLQLAGAVEAVDRRRALVTHRDVVVACVEQIRLEACERPGGLPGSAPADEQDSAVRLSDCCAVQ